MKRVSGSTYISVFNIIVIVLLIVAFARASFQSSSILTFSGFLQVLSGCPSIQMSYLNDLTITADWFAFNFLRDFLNFTCMYPLEAILFFATNILNVLIFCFYFVSNLFFV